MNSEIGLTLNEFPDICEFLQEAESTLVKVWKDEIATYFIVSRVRGEIPVYSLLNFFGSDDLPHSASTMFHCGYVIFKPSPFSGSSIFDVDGADVHGGVTYARRFDNNVQIYGFDCAHAHDEWDENCKNIEWLTAQCEQMGREILRIKKEEENKDIY